ncbi:MAG: Lhr family helicase, partial [Spirochaetota bacterium]
GIDVGDVQCVLLVQSPGEVSSALQRIGRSNHRVGEVSRGIIFPTHGTDIVSSALVARLVREKDIEPVRIPENPLDVLAQVILSMTLTEAWNVDALFDAVRCVYSFNGLGRRLFDLVIEMLAGRYAGARIRELTPKVDFDRISGSVRARDGVRYRLFSSGGMIPDRGQYSLRLKKGNRKIGELDEEFVWERNTGDTFALGVQSWQIDSITHNDVFVVPTKKSPGIIPFWRAEARNRSFYVSERYLLFLKELERMMESGEAMTQYLTESCMLEADAAVAMEEFLARQRESTSSPLPHRHNLLVEEFADPDNASDNRQIILHTLWGGRVNRPLAFALSGYWQKEFGYSLEIFADNDNILVQLPHDTDLLAVLREIGKHNIHALLHHYLEQSGYFGAIFRENAARSLLLPPKGFKYRQPLWLNRLRARKLLETVSHFEDFPVTIETWRQVYMDEFDMDSLIMLLDELHDGRIAVSRCKTASPSPFASGIIWNRTNRYMYEDDTPRGGKGTRTSRSLIEEIARTAGKIEIPADIVMELDGRLKRTAQGYAQFSDSNELLEWITDRLCMPYDEFDILIDAAARDMSMERESLLAEIARQCVLFTKNGIDLAASAESFVRLLAAGLAGNGDYRTLPCSAEPPDAAASVDALVAAYRAVTIEDVDPELLFNQFLAYYAVLPEGMAAALFRELYSDGTVDSLLDSDMLYRGMLVLDDDTVSIALPDNYERLLRLLRRFRQREVSIRPVTDLLPFLMTNSGISSSHEECDLRDILDRLIGYFAPVRLWEEEILPARCRSYRPMLFDSLFTSSPLVISGSKRKRCAFFFEHELSMYGVFSGREEYERFYSGRPFTVQEIIRDSGASSAAATKEVWGRFFSGAVYTQSMETVRGGMHANFEPSSGTDQPRGRSPFSRWKMSRPFGAVWYAAPPKEEDPDAGRVQFLEECKETARQLLLRYGILFRQLYEQETLPFTWRDLFKALRIMDLSGEVYSGYFFHGVDSVQFISMDAFARFETFDAAQVGGWLCAADPVSLSGRDIPFYKEVLPHRKENSHFVLSEGAVVLACSRSFRKLDFRIPPEAVTSDTLAPLYNALMREVNPVTRIRVEEINGVQAVSSEYTAALAGLGFRRDGKYLLLEKRYGI